MNREEIMAKFKELDEMELACREFYNSKDGMLITIPQGMEDVKALIGSPGNRQMDINKVFLRIELQHEESIPEETFLNIKSDVAVLKHMRYLPAMIHSHSFIEIVYVLEGHCSHSTGDVTFEMEKGDICLVAPDVKHYISVFDDESIILNLLVRRSTFDTAFFELLAEDDILSDFFARIIYGANKMSPYILFRAGGDESLRNIILDLYSEYESSKRHKERMVNILLMLFCTLLLRNHEKDVSVINPVVNKQDDNIVLALRYIKNNFSTVTFTHVAKLFNYSEAHFSRLIKEYTGRTFSEIVREIKVKKAAELLLNPAISTNEIVEKVGYTDVSHFYRNFKQHYGMTPIEYRNKSKESSAI